MEILIEKFANDWMRISSHEFLSEDFIDKYNKLVDWKSVSVHQRLSEAFIQSHKHLVCWDGISAYQKLSEQFICKNKNLVNWYLICQYQKLSEDFIDKNRNLVNWDRISKYQKLSEEFIRINKDVLIWNRICKYQKLSESFIVKYLFYIDLEIIARYQKLSKEFIEKYNLSFDEENNTLYWSKEQKLVLAKKHGYKIINDDYILAYKGIRNDFYCFLNFQYKFEKGKTYESHADHNLNNESSFGLSAWSKKEATSFCSQLVVQVKIKLEDISAITYNSSKIRATKLTILG
jgi:hypothetical protein